MKTLIAAIIASLVLLSACSNLETTRSGFLNNYEQMQPDGKGTLTYSNSLAQKRYTAFLVDDVQYSQGDKGEVLNAEQIATLKDTYRNAVTKAFSDNYTLVSTPAANVMRVRLSITSVNKSTVPLNYVSTLVLLTPVSNGGISTESEIVDALTGERLSALSTHSNPNVLDGKFSGYFNPIGHAKAALESHAAQLRETIAPR
ncbi:MAG: hypothetical protein BWK73_35460 [Thiothrix lacustris]|uniref:DUF3313 domain-containing protein n=1 Tax=Thiothrix lacustris TaxID=525917 RepID=A0A1Y1QFY2_9GAMM|nr:MAG: hypothetical protein BWK73_35460 [Thiothrix lacustris]